MYLTKKKFTVSRSFSTSINIIHVQFECKSKSALRISAIIIMGLKCIHECYGEAIRTCINLCTIDKMAIFGMYMPVKLSRLTRKMIYCVFSYLFFIRSMFINYNYICNNKRNRHISNMWYECHLRVAFVCDKLMPWLYLSQLWIRSSQVQIVIK